MKESVIKCACPVLDGMECARRRHISSSCDDFIRSILSEEADCFDSDDACECSCHDRDEDEEYSNA